MAEPDLPQESASEALLRARQHAKRGVSEVILAVRALLDAAALSLGRQPAHSHALFAPLSQVLDEWSVRLGRSDDDVGVLILDALESEIARWESRSQEDEEARSVLRAFLGLREFLWELGIRPTASPGDAAPAKDAEASTDPMAETHPPSSRVPA